MSEPLAVSLDVSAVPSSPAGAGRYTVELANALSERTDVATALVCRSDDAARWARYAPGPAGRGRVLAAAPGPRPLRLAWEQVGLPGVLSRAGVAVHHGPHYTMPEWSAVPAVVTIHDCTFFDHPEWHERTKAPFFRRAIRRAARRAAALVCVSATTAEALRRVCEVRAPIFVAPHGVDLGRFTPEEPAPGADAAALASLGVDPAGAYVAFVGTLEPRKDVGRLVAAFDRIAASVPDLQLVLAGQQGWGEDEVGRALAASSHADRVRRLGYVDDDAVPALLRRAAVVAYPSLEEGYGLPALEALACGAPLVTTAGTAMAEMAAGAAVLVPPGDTAALAGALEAAVRGDGVPEVGDRGIGAQGAAGSPAARRAAGLAVAATRTWAASAERHLAAYRCAAGGPTAGDA